MTIRSATKTTLMALAAVALFGVEAEAQRTFEVQRIRATFRSEAPLETINGLTNEGSGSIRVDPSNLSSASGTITIPVRTLRTGIELRDEHLVGPEWLDAGNHPNATFVITGVSGASSLQANQDVNLRVTGRFTIHGVTKNVTARLRVRWDGGSTLRARAQFQIELDDYNVSINPAVQAKVSNEITIQVDIRAST